MDRRALLRRLAVPALGLAAAATTAPLARRSVAHGAQAHGFALVEFARPFTAPPFTLARLDGEPTALAEFRGRFVLLNFWATWCPPCLAEMPAMDALYQRFDRQDLVVVAVSSDADGAVAVRPFVQRLGITFPILLDPDGAVSKLYGARDLPVSFVIDRAGAVVSAAKGAREWNSEAAVSYLSERIRPV